MNIFLEAIAEVQLQGVKEFFTCTMKNSPYYPQAKETARNG
jgi:hypothetical protein